MITFSVISLGCKVNDYEANYIKEELSKDYKEVDNNAKADIYVIFSCCVTNVAEAKTRKCINRVRRMNNGAYICVVGCYSQTKPDSSVFDNVDLLIGSSHKIDIPKYIKEKQKMKLIENNRSLGYETMFINNYLTKSRAFLKIQDGCNQFCSYCIIPYSRGNERSEDHNILLNNAKELSKKYKEIVLTGIHTGRYNDNGYNLFNLLSDLIKIDNLQTIRLSSIEINEISDEIIELIRSSNKIAKHLHIPIQSLNNTILKEMNRPYSIEEYISRINYIRSKIKDISISTDLIVGFAGEDDEIFNSFFDYLDKIKFSFIHVFPYSIKTGTKAASFSNQIDNKTKKIRVNKIIEYEKSITNSYLKNQINTFNDVLVESFKDNYSFGYTKNYNYAKVYGKYNIGDIIRIKIIDVIDNIIIGEYVS